MGGQNSLPWVMWGRTLFSSTRLETACDLRPGPRQLGAWTAHLEVFLPRPALPGAHLARWRVGWRYGRGIIVGIIGVLPQRPDSQRAPVRSTPSLGSRTVFGLLRCRLPWAGRDDARTTALSQMAAAQGRQHGEKRMRKANVQAGSQLVIVRSG